MATFSDMINYSYPDAVKGVDFTLKSDTEGNPEIDYWNEEKLGPEPDILKIHASYMKSVKRRKQMIPT